jgi:septal ring factor EnvC (AmiA/AmiB activator)
MNRRSFVARLAALVVAPAVPVPAQATSRVDARALAAELRQVQADIARMEAFMRRPMLNFDQLSQYRNQVENTVRQNTKAPCGP